MSEPLLTSEVGARLYHKYAERLPIIDFHCHLQPREILEDRVFEDLGEMWLMHDHYKWRCMRAFGIDERLITGGASYREKFMAFAEIFPMLVGNPVYGWCQLELARYFGIEDPLGPDTARAIYDEAKAQIGRLRMSPRYFIAQSNVEYIATTDDPADDLRCHEAIAKEGSMAATVAPAFRPDAAMNIGSPGFARYIARLAGAAGIEIGGFEALINALDARMAFFAAHGARVTDHGLDSPGYAESTPEQLDAIFAKAMCGAALSRIEVEQYQTAFLVRMAGLCAKRGLLMQMHIGALRNVNGGMFAVLGADAGYDACDDRACVRSIGALLGAMDRAGAMPRVLLYPINGAQFEPMAVLAAAFCGGVKAKVSLGAPWWFNDQAHGIRRQFEACGQHYPLALSAGMVTDSRSFLSYPRHELYRRVLCEYLGELVERGEYVGGEPALARVIEAVCYKNAKEYLRL